MMCSEKNMPADSRPQGESSFRPELIADDVAHFHDADIRNNADCCAAGYLGIAPWNCRLTIGETEIVLNKAD